VGENTPAAGAVQRPRAVEVVEQAPHFVGEIPHLGERQHRVDLAHALHDRTDPSARHTAGLAAAYAGRDATSLARV